MEDETARFVDYEEVKETHWLFRFGEGGRRSLSSGELQGESRI